MYRSPIGDAFRRRLRMFPSLVNCCTIDWFRAWPADALDAVASTFLAEVEMETHVRASVVEMCKTFQLQVYVYKHTSLSLCVCITYIYYICVCVCVYVYICIYTCAPPSSRCARPSSCRC